VTFVNLIRVFKGRLASQFLVQVGDNPEERQVFVFVLGYSHQTRCRGNSAYSV